MAMVLNAFVELFVTRLAALMEEEMVKLLGLEEDLVQLEETLLRIKAVLFDAESKKISEESIGLWLSKIRELMYDADDLLDDCQSQSPSPFSRRYHYVPSLLSSLMYVPFCHKIGKRIRRINSALEKLQSEIPMLKLIADLPNSNPTIHNFVLGHSGWNRTTSVVVESEIVGIDEDAKRLVDLLTEGVSRNTYRFPVFAIIGMPGIGKTTLAKKVFNDSRVTAHFTIVTWICVSKTYNEVELLKEILRSIKRQENRKLNSGVNVETANDTHVDVQTKDELCSEICKHVKNKKFFLVLDDVWNENVWEDLLRQSVYDIASDDSKVLITTRREDTARGMRATHYHKVKEMSNEEGWSMLCKVVFRDEDEKETKKYEGIGMEIVKKCSGLPLAIKVVAGVLKRKDRNLNAWERVHSSQTWALTGLPEDIKPGLLLSYYDLPSPLKQCFIYCSLFPEDFIFFRPKLVQMWIAEGFVKDNVATRLSMEDLGDDYYNELVVRNLLQEVPDYFDRLRCKMHDLVRSLALYVSQNEHIHEDPFCLRCTSKKPRHLTFVKKNVDIVPDKDKKYECLRTLLLCNPSIETIPFKLFDKLTRLRVLDISYTAVCMLPDSLGNLIHLRFLSVSFTKIRSLPDSIKKLKNLETLKANGSKYLHRLPKGITQLNKLRHLTVGGTDNQLDSMPLGIGNLNRLRSLIGFVVNTCGGSNFRELQSLSDLAELSVYNLENIAGKEHAEEAKLWEKTNLKYLRLSCSHRTNAHQLDGEEPIKRIEEVFEGINPPRSLEIVYIQGFFGHVLPSFITECSLLRNLTWLRFQDCRLVKELPPLCSLLELTDLQILGAATISKIGSEFFGGAKGFPKLQKLYLHELPELVSISDLEDGTMCCLKTLHIGKCPKLKSLPTGLNHVKSLMKLVIMDCENLERIDDLNCVTELELKGNSKLITISDFPSLNLMCISNCSSLTEVENVGNLSYLFLSDDNMDVLPRWLENITVKRLNVQGKTHLVSRMCNGGDDCPIVKNILHVEARSNDGLSYMSYRKDDPFIFHKNLTQNVGVSS